jgi:hypothetical protein
MSDARRSFRATLDAFLRYCEDVGRLRGSTLHDYRRSAVALWSVRGAVA